MLYASNAENKRKELQEYGAEVLFYDKTTGMVIVKQLSGNPEEKALNEYYNRKYAKNIGESTEGSAVLPISELKRMMSNGEIVSYGEGLLTGYGITEKDAKINYEVRKNVLDTGIFETIISGYRVTRGAGLVSAASGCTVVSSGGCSLIATGVGTAGYTEILFGANDLIGGLGSINNALINKRASGYNAANEYIRQLITEEVRQPNVGKGINPLREGMSGLNLPDWVYTTANSTSFVSSVLAEPYKELLTPISKYVFEENLRRTEKNWQTESVKDTVVRMPNGDYKLGMPTKLPSSIIYNYNNETVRVGINYGIPNLEYIISNNIKLYTVVPEMGELDENRKTLLNGNYIKNPSAKNITEYVNETNYLGTGGKKGALNGQYMYVIDSKGDITIGKRMRGFNGINDGLPHPTLIGGSNPKVQGAGIVNIQGGKIYKIDNASGHFRPGSESLKKAEEFFFKNVPNKYYSKDFQGFQTYDGK